MRSRTLLLDLLALLAAALLLTLALLVHRDPGLTRYAYAPYSFFLLEPQEVTEEVVHEYAGVRRTYTLTVPEGNVTATGASLLFYLRHTVARVELEGGELRCDSAETPSRHIGHTPGNYWVRVPLRPACAGKTVRVTLTPVYGSVRGETPTFWLIGHEQLLNMVLLPQDALMLALCAAAVLVGLFLPVLALALPIGGHEKRELLCLGAVSAAAGLWKLTGLPSVALMQDALGWHKELWYFGAACYMLTLLCSLRLLVCMREGRGERVGGVCFTTAAALTLCAAALQIFDAAELHGLLVPYGVVLALLHLIVLFSQKPERAELFWFLPLLLALGLDLLGYRLTGSLHNAPVFLGWTLLLLTVRGVGFLRAALQRERLLRERESELREARANFLVSQIRPHFIYNALLSVYALCRSDPMRAREAIESFNAYLMANFSGISATEPITFLDELRHTRAYLDVETMLHGDNLSVTYDTPHTAFRLPALTLQPIVENAVKHGMAAEHPRERIAIRTRQFADGSELVVEDDGVGYDPASVPDDATHVGLQSVRDRLEMLCGGTLETVSAPGCGTRVTVFIPKRD